MIYALIVVYNKECENSESIRSIINYKEKIKLIVFDNSTKKNNNENFCKTNDIAYYTVNKNIGLSRAYNFSISKIKNSDNNNYLIILDDDTNLNKEYFDELLEETNKEKFDIILPKVLSKNIIISPTNTQFNCRIQSVKDIEKIKKISAINSGMIVNLNVYDKIKYNEDMFLDYIDHEFMKQVREKNLKIHIMKSSIYQNFSRDQINKIESEIIRFKIYKRDFKIYCKNCKKMLYYYLSMFLYSIKNSIKYKNIVFLKLAMEREKV